MYDGPVFFTFLQGFSHTAWFGLEAPPSYQWRSQGDKD